MILSLVIIAVLLPAIGSNEEADDPFPGDIKLDDLETTSDGSHKFISGMPTSLWTEPGIFPLTVHNWTDIFDTSDYDGGWLLVFSTAAECPECQVVSKVAARAVSTSSLFREGRIKTAIMDYRQAVSVEGRFLVTLVPSVFYIQGSHTLIEYSRKPNWPHRVEHVLSFLTEVSQGVQKEKPRSTLYHPTRFYMAPIGWSWVLYHLADDAVGEGTFQAAFSLGESYGLTRWQTACIMLTAFAISLQLSTCCLAILMRRYIRRKNDVLLPGERRQKEKGV